MKIVIGTAQFGMDYGISNKQGKMPKKFVSRIIDLAKKYEIDTLDTAPAYGDSEKRLGKLGVQDFKVISKISEFSNEYSNINNAIRSQIEKSLERLNIQSMHGLLIHKSEHLLSNDGDKIYEALIAAKNENLVKKIGVSVYSPEEILKIISRYDVDMFQTPFNIIDRRIETSGCLDILSKKSIEVHARSVFLQGLLLIPKYEMPDKFKHWSNIWNDWHDWLSENSISAVHACLNFVLEHPQINKIVVGIENAEQLEEIVAFSNKSLSYKHPSIECDDINLINPANWN